MKSFPCLSLSAGCLLAASVLTGCGTPLGNLKPGPVLPVTATPTFSPSPGTFTTTQIVSIADGTPNATIYYTTDGTIPTQLSPVYTTPIKLQSTKTVSAIAVVTGQVQSQIGYGAFDIDIPAPKYTFHNVAIVGGGFVDGVFFHPKLQGLMYARTDVGGAYRYLAGTDSQWTPLTDFVTASQNGALLGVESLGLDPSDPQRLYLGMGEYDGGSSPNGEFELSDDQGNTFTQVDAPFKMGANENGRFAGERFAVDPQLGTNLWYGTRDAGLYNSADRGMTWNPVKSFPVTATTGTTADPGAGVIFEAVCARERNGERRSDQDFLCRRIRSHHRSLCDQRRRHDVSSGGWPACRSVREFLRVEFGRQSLHHLQPGHALHLKLHQHRSARRDRGLRVEVHAAHGRGSGRRVDQHHAAQSECSLLWIQFGGG